MIGVFITFLKPRRVPSFLVREELSRSEAH